MIGLMHRILAALMDKSIDKLNFTKNVLNVTSYNRGNT